jgi:hypothetical protein
MPIVSATRRERGVVRPRHRDDRVQADGLDRARSAEPTPHLRIPEQRVHRCQILEHLRT